MESTSKTSLLKLQVIMEKELQKMPTTPERQRSLDLRHTIDCNSNHQIKSALRNIRTLKSLNLDSDRKREPSLTSTRIAEFSHSNALKNISSAERLQKGRDLKQSKLGSRTKLKKKLSKQDSPKPFQKSRTRQRIQGEDESPKLKGWGQRRDFTSGGPIRLQRGCLQPAEYEAIIERQRMLIEQLQKIIESWQQI